MKPLSMTMCTLAAIKLLIFVGVFELRSLNGCKNIVLGILSIYQFTSDKNKNKFGGVQSLPRRK